MLNTNDYFMSYPTLQQGMYAIHIMTTEIT